MPKKGPLVEEDDMRRGSVIEGSDSMPKLAEENTKNKQLIEQLKTKLKREEDSRKHWQDIARKKEEEVAELQKANEEAKAAIDE